MKQILAILGVPIKISTGDKNEKFAKISRSVKSDLETTPDSNAPTASSFFFGEYMRYLCFPITNSHFREFGFRRRVLALFAIINQN